MEKDKKAEKEYTIDEAIHLVESFNLLRKQMPNLINNFVNSGDRKIHKHTIHNITKALEYSQTYLYKRIKDRDFTPEDIKEILLYIKMNSPQNRLTEVLYKYENRKGRKQEEGADAALPTK